MRSSGFFFSHGDKFFQCSGRKHLSGVGNTEKHPQRSCSNISYFRHTINHVYNNPDFLSQRFLVLNYFNFFVGRSFVKALKYERFLTKDNGLAL
jgi:hypothetical protein